MFHEIQTFICSLYMHVSCIKHFQLADISVGHPVTSLYICPVIQDDPIAVIGFHRYMLLTYVNRYYEVPVRVQTSCYGHTQIWNVKIFSPGNDITSGKYSQLDMSPAVISQILMSVSHLSRISTLSTSTFRSVRFSNKIPKYLFDLTFYWSSKQWTSLSRFSYKFVPSSMNFG